MDELDLVKLEIEAVGKPSSRNFETYSLMLDLTEVHKRIFLKYLKYDMVQIVSDENVKTPLWKLMAAELNSTKTKYSKDVWLRLLKSWMNYVKLNLLDNSADQTSDNILRQMLHETSVRPTSTQLSCILDHIEMIGHDLPSVWKTISAKLTTETEKKSELYWMQVYENAKERIAIKAELLESMRRNEIEITDDFQLTENDNRILGILSDKKSIFDQIKVDCVEDDECRICLERSVDLINLFREHDETPSIIEKLLECSRISQITEADGFPQNICRNCVSQLEIAFHFRILSEISERKLRSRIIANMTKKTATIPDEMEQCEDDQGDLDDTNNYEIDDASYELQTDNTETNCESWDLKFKQEDENNDQQVVLHQCETCGLTFDSSKLLKKHIRCHAVAPIASRECKICSKIFKSEALLRAHGRTHSDLRPYICETCGKAFKTTSQLASHCLTHSDVKNFQCPHCTYRGNTNNNLRIHLRTHTRVQPYSCRFCQWKFSTASNMQKHIRNIHHKMRTHQCNECEKSFFAKESLRKHMVTHSGIKLYSCSVCSASYAWYNGLKKHMRIQHVGEKCPSEITFRPTKTMC